MNLYKIIEKVGEYAPKVGGGLLVLCGMGIFLTNIYSSFFGLGIGALVTILGAMIITNEE